MTIAGLATSWINHFFKKDLMMTENTINNFRDASETLKIIQLDLDKIRELFLSEQLIIDSKQKYLSNLNINPEQTENSSQTNEPTLKIIPKEIHALSLRIEMINTLEAELNNLLTRDITTVSEDIHNTHLEEISNFSTNLRVEIVEIAEKIAKSTEKLIKLKENVGKISVNVVTLPSLLFDVYSGIDNLVAKFKTEFDKDIKKNELIIEEAEIIYNQIITNHKTIRVVPFELRQEESSSEDVLKKRQLKTVDYNYITTIKLIDLEQNLPIIATLHPDLTNNRDLNTLVIHRDKITPIPHFDLEIGFNGIERNIHIIPTEYEDEFNTWILRIKVA